jgi:hypothetical protein
MSFKKIKRWRSKNYLDWVKTLPCAICGADAEPHHIKGCGHYSGAGLKADDILTMPLCHQHHMACHDHPESFGQERMVIDTILQAARGGILKCKK